MQRKLAAILSADVVGYSGLMEADEAGTLQRLKENRSSIFDPCVAKHSGRIVKNTGDAALVQGGPALSLPIFDGGRLRNQLAKSDADYDLAVADYDQALVGAVREVADALQSARALEAQIDSITQARDAAQRAWDLSTARYRAGLGTQLDVLAAQRPLLQYDQQRVALRAQRLQATVDLQRADEIGVEVHHLGLDPPRFLRTLTAADISPA